MLFFSWFDMLYVTVKPFRIAKSCYVMKHFILNATKVVVKLFFKYINKVFH